MIKKQTSLPKKLLCYELKFRPSTSAWVLPLKAKRFLTIAGISVAVILVGAGCKSLPGKLEIDTPFFDVEYEGKEAA